MNKSKLPFGIFFILSLELGAQDNCCDRLEKKVVQVENLNNTIRDTTKSLNLIIKNLKFESDTLKTSVDRLRSESIKWLGYTADKKQVDKANEQFENLKKNTVSTATYKLQTEELDRNKKDLADCRNLVSKKEDAVQAAEKVSRALQENVDKTLGLIDARYKKSFEELVKSTTPASLESDLVIIKNLDVNGSRTQLLERINELNLFKQAQALLGKKYDDAEINRAKSSLKPIMDEEAMKQLVKLLESYGGLSVNFKNTLLDIQKKNELKAGSSDDLISEKKSATLQVIEDFVYYTKVDLGKYVFINQIITELKNRKMTDVDADIKDLLQRL
jgi:hypothetical protein